MDLEAKVKLKDCTVEVGDDGMDKLIRKRNKRETERQNVASGQEMGEASASMSIKNENQASEEQPTNATPHYPYTPPPNFKTLGELVPSGELENIIGVVSFFTPVAPSKGSDYYMKLYLIDPTCCEHKSHDYREVLIFNHNPSRFPDIHSTGDIIRFHRIKASHYGSHVQLLSNHATSFLVFSGTCNEEISLANARYCSRNPSLTPGVISAVRQLREWLHLNQDVL